MPLYNSVIDEPLFYKKITKHKIGVIAPSSSITTKDIETLKQLQNLQLNIPDDLQSNVISYHAHTDEQRFKLLWQALEQDDIDIVWALRGGYGSARLIEKLQEKDPPKKEKIFIGHSDITALHLFLSQHWGWHTIHGANLVGLLDQNANSENYLRLANIIAGNKEQKIIDLKAFNATAKNTQEIQGNLTGGNLSVIQTSIGTSWQIQTAGKILLLEDVNEAGYKIDRSLNHLYQSGILKKVMAIIFGDFGLDNDVLNALTRFSQDISAIHNVPVFKTDKFGHGVNNLPLVYNSKGLISLCDKDLGQYDLKLQY